MVEKESNNARAICRKRRAEAMAAIRTDPAYRVQENQRNATRNATRRDTG